MQRAHVCVTCADSTPPCCLSLRVRLRDQPTIEFETISTAVLENCVQYFYYKQRYDHTAPPLPPFKLETESIVKMLLVLGIVACVVGLKLLH